jgi:hypothetical protein
VQIVAAILWVHATVGLQPHPEVREAAFRAAALYARSFNVQDASKAMYAMRSLSYRESRVANTLTEICRYAGPRAVRSLFVTCPALTAPVAASL